MVAQKEIQASNALINDVTAPQIAVFVGGTSGIGKFTIKALVATNASLRIYLVGRKSSEERMQTFIQELHAINPKAEIIWTEGEIALLAESNRICDVIKNKESRVDLLFLSAGYAPFSGRKETTEGIDTVQSLEYYSRILFIQQLLPLLSKAEAPRVLSVLGGGLERTNNIDLNDLALKKPGNYGAFKAQTQCVAMNTMVMDKLASEHPNITFIHSWPGWVNTGNVRRGSDPNSLMAWFTWLILEPIVGFFSITDDNSGQRYLFQSTSAAFGGRGTPWKGKPGVNTLGKATDGVFLINYKCDCTPNTKAIAQLREKTQDKVWDHTQEVLRPYL